MNLIHGGDWAGFYDEYGREPLDFSANVSPLGLPEGVKRAAISALEQAERYPDPLCRSLRRKLSVLHAVPEDNILCGSGAADLIFRLALSLHPQKALVTAPTFAEYEQSLKAVDCEVEHFMLKAEKGFAITDELLDYITPKLSMLFLCEPNNPTGRTTERYLLERVLEKCTACGTVLVVDECFNEFLDKPQEHTLQGELATHKNLVILKAFTKCYAMAGLRLGYILCGDDTLTQRLREAGQPWAVSNIAQAAGEAALLETQYIESEPALPKGVHSL
ncbi:MAG: aminotransferase class I/II-fold pyridoxal phosphate-dependent enzyme [Angelakisella sp.]